MSSTWPIIASILTVSLSLITVAWTIYKGMKADNAAENASTALNMSANIQATFTAQRNLINELQEEQKRLQIDNSDLRKKLERANLEILRLNTRVTELTNARA